LLPRVLPWQWHAARLFGIVTFFAGLFRAKPTQTPESEPGEPIKITSIVKFQTDGFSTWEHCFFHARLPLDLLGFLLKVRYCDESITIHSMSITLVVRGFSFCSHYFVQEHSTQLRVFAHGGLGSLHAFKEF
jgi:hypothetical protein